MEISIFGLGYVGSVSLGCLASLGHKMIGVDVSPIKVDFINKGKSPIVENEIDGIIAEQRAKNSISATTDIDYAVKNSEVSFICVGTPSTPQGHLDLNGIFRVAKDIGNVLSGKNGFHVIAIRSTVLPGTNRKVAEIISSASGKKNGTDFAVVSNPEFLREGTAVRDYFNPPFTLIGTDSKMAVEVMRGVYAGLDSVFIDSEIGVAEMLKYVNNSFHALKIAFANEVGAICKSAKINSHELMKVFCRDTKLNISPSYLMPGFAYGGSCLPKDLKALCTIAHDNYIRCPVLENIHASNENIKDQVLERIIEFNKRNIGFLGLSFKEGTDDLRSSPIVDIMEKLLGKGFDIQIYDRNVHFSKLMGANREYIMNKIPFISRFITENVDGLLEKSEILIVVNKDREFAGILDRCKDDTIILDLVNLDFSKKTIMANYHGVAW